MFLTVAALAKSKSKYILVRMKSAAETGYCFNVRRLRLQEKLVLLRYDPIDNTSMPTPDMQMPDLLILSVLIQDFCVHNIGMCKPRGQVEADEETLSRATVLYL
ncbi:large ribosomal subunit protein bL33m isoform X1 [Aptenodytes patagonicus]|uniref:large ribosomal subunit protein bL33m isoform X1 n=1 Tax=Aptenodytes patagonicus TaxID=9234 RepID=UPI003F9FEB15